MVQPLALGAEDKTLLAGLPEMMGTRPYQIMELTRKNGCGSASRSCYYAIRWPRTTCAGPEPRSQGNGRALECRVT